MKMVTLAEVVTENARKKNLEHLLTQPLTPEIRAMLRENSVVAELPENEEIENMMRRMHFTKMVQDEFLRDRPLDSRMTMLQFLKALSLYNSDFEPSQLLYYQKTPLGKFHLRKDIDMSSLLPGSSPVRDDPLKFALQAASMLGFTDFSLGSWRGGFNFDLGSEKPVQQGYTLINILMEGLAPSRDVALATWPFIEKIPENAPKSSRVSIDIAYYKNGLPPAYRYDTQPMPDRVLEYLMAWHRAKPAFSDKLSDLAENGLAAFGPHGKNIVLQADFNVRPSASILSNEASISIIQPSPGSFLLNTRYLFSFYNWDAFSDVGALVPNVIDYRPYMHRILEIAAGRSFGEFHDPRIYLKQNSGVEPELAASIDLLFTADEAAGLKGRIAEAQLRATRFASVPHLNLGLKKLPTPGNLNVESVSEAGNYLVAQLSSLGVMPAAEARELVMRRVLNYAMPKFQLSIADAKALVEAL